MLSRIEEKVQQENLWAAGFIGYEAAPAFDSALTTKPPSALPLLWFGVYGAPTAISPAVFAEQTQVNAIAWDTRTGQPAYQQAIERIKAYIEAGDTYQINHTFRLHASFDADPWPFFRHLIAAQGSSYGVFLNTPNWALCSASPELFFRLDGHELTSRPMKGTLPRGLWPADDLARATKLRASDKERAENVMIVDMVRNDLGRIADIGSVQVPSLFDVEQYPTVWQMTSTVRCKTQAGFTDIFRALFPAASIIGTPKRRAMEIIAELESTPRGPYTGSIGFIAPKRRAQFNVAIRTAWLDKLAKRAEYGVGGGIVWDSTAQSEYQECYAKAQILTAAQPEFSLLETLLWEPDRGYLLLEQHLNRLKHSARFFAYPLDVAEIRRQLAATVANLPPQPHKVRLLMTKEGTVRLEVQKLAKQRNISHLVLAKTPVNPSDVFLYHKTTQREVYEKALRENSTYDDVLLWNEDGEITESCVANVIFEQDGAWYTPPIHCGLLAGVYRAFLLEQGRLRERILRVEELGSCTEIRLVNSVRREWHAILEAG